MKKILGTAALVVVLMWTGCGIDPRPFPGRSDPKAEYAEKLKDPRWQKLRLRILERDRWRCQSCGARSHLNVHHRYYVKGREPWEYPAEALITLCRRCHEKVHGHGIVDWFGAIWKVNDNRTSDGTCVLPFVLQ